MAQNTPAQQLSDMLVTRGYDPEMLDSTGRPASSAEDAEIFSFEFISSEGTNYGTVVVMLSDNKELQLFSGDNVGRGMDSEDKTEWYEFQHQLKNFATKNFMTFGSQNINRLKYSMQGQAALKEGLFESWNGTKNVSWNAGPDAVRLMIRHKRPMGVNEARFRQVESLFVETAEGERYKLPFRNLAGGRAMVEHVRQGGRPYDMRGQHIANIVEELNVLSRFRRASHGKVFEGDTANLVNETNVYYATASKTLKGLASSRGYNTYFESWNPADVTEQDLIIENIKTLFVEQTIDSRIEQALPILARIQQQGTAMKEANIFEAWANNLLEGTWATPDTPEQQQKLIALLSQELPVGADATNATEQLYDLVGDDILFDQLADLADQDANADCRSVVVTRIKQMADSGFNDFVPVLDALKAEQMIASAPQQPQPPVAEEVSAEAMYDPTDDDSHDYGTDLLVTIRRLYSNARDGKDLGEQIASLNRMKDGIEQSEDPRLQQTYAFLMKNLAGGAVTDPKMIMQIADKAHQLFHPSLEPIAQATREAVGDEEYSVDGGMNNELLQDYMEENNQDTITRLRELSGMNKSQMGIVEGKGNLAKALDAQSGNWSGWYDTESTDPNIEKFEWDDGEGGFYASGSIEHNLQTGEIEVHYHDSENDIDVDGTFKNMGDAMRALRGQWGQNHGGKAPNFDRLGQRKQHGPDDLRKTDRTGRKGTLAGGPSNELKRSIQFNKGKHGPQGVLPEAEDYDDGMYPVDLSSNPSFKQLVNRYTQLFYQGHEGTYDDEEAAESDAIEQYVAKRFGQKGSDHLLKAAQASYGGRDDGRGLGGHRGDNLGYASMPVGNFRTTSKGKMHKQDVGSKKQIIGNRLGQHPEPVLPESDHSVLSGQYGHSGKLQNFDDVEQDVLQRLRELSGMIRS